MIIMILSLLGYFSLNILIGFIIILISINDNGVTLWIRLMDEFVEDFLEPFNIFKYEKLAVSLAIVKTGIMLIPAMFYFFLIKQNNIRYKLITTYREMA